MPLSPYPDWLIFLRLIISDNQVIVTDQFIFQPCAFIGNVLFHFLRPGNILRSNIAHRASPRFTPVSQKIGPDDRIGTALDGIADVVHVVGLPLFKVLEHIRKRTGRLQERLALLIG